MIRLSVARALALGLALTWGQAPAQFDPCADHTFAEIETWMHQLAAANPSATVASYGNSYEGRPLLSLSVRPAPGLPVIVCVGANSPND